MVFGLLVHLFRLFLLLLELVFAQGCVRCNTAAGRSVLVVLGREGGGEGGRVRGGWESEGRVGE